MSVYLAFHDADWKAHRLSDEDEEAGVPEEFQPPRNANYWDGPIPRVGEFVIGVDLKWWAVLAVSYSSLRPLPVQGEVTCWVDVTVRRVEHDPREVEP